MEYNMGQVKLYSKSIYFNYFVYLTNSPVVYMESI